jgi:allophanate hydrolase
MPLNAELKSFGARLLETTTTAADYRLFLLSGTSPSKPGLLRVGTGSGTAIEIEVWAMPAGNFGRFIATVPPPLSIGTLHMADGRAVRGFLVEAEATRGARDISTFGGWRAFMDKAKARA